ncbi:MAG: NEW3 domain-containing protein [Actinobacteria bacterium]|nr:NEW3 domain-containing protein [Actinomycetota bacterium]
MERRSKKFRISLIAIITLFLLSVVLLIPGMIFAADTSTDTTTPETVNIPETIKFDVTFPEIKAKAGASFSFAADLTYQGDEEQTFDLITKGPDGWYVSIAPSYQESEISAIKMVPGKKESLKITATPLIKQGPGEYDITITAKNDDLKLEATTTFKAIITATYDFTLTSKTGMLNTKATSGKNNPFIVVLTSMGSADIENITLKADAPEKWIVKFDPEKIETFKSEETKEIKVTITPPDKTIAGDYMLTFSANSENVSKNIDVRVTVETPSIWGWVGIGIIVIVVIGVAVIFARLGRR